MSYGLIVKNNDNKTFISPNITPMNFVKRTDILFKKFKRGEFSLDTDIPDNYVVLPFVRVINTNNSTPNYAAIRVTGLTSKNGMRVITFRQDNVNSDVTVEVYLFSNYVPKLTKYGLEIYNEKQEMVYNNACLPLEIYFLKKPDTHLFGKDYGDKKTDSVMIDLGHPVAAISTSYGLKSFHAGAQNGHATYHIFSTAINYSVGLHLMYHNEGKYKGAYPDIGDIAYIDTRKYQ
jgi:hypothetical protein